MTVVYVICCGSPAARDVGRLVSLLQGRGYETCVVSTPDGRKFIDVPALAEQTGHPVRSFYKQPGEPDVLPAAQAFIVAPATVNTVNKWSAGICDTLALGLVVEGQSLGVPVIVMPFTNRVHGSHPAFKESLARLRSWGIEVLFGPEVMQLQEPGKGEEVRALFPWHLAVEALERSLSR